MPGWKNVLELNSDREQIAGSTSALARAICAGADLRIGTAFRHNEHIDVGSDNDELIREVMDFRITYLLDDRWVAGIENLRMPVRLPDGFGPRPSMSFFLYNQDGRQAIARPHLDGRPAKPPSGPAPPQPHAEMPKYHELASWDADSNAPSSNFIYDFEYFRFFVRDSWREVLAHDAEGTVVSGSVESLAEAVGSGHEVKVALVDLCADLSTDSEHAAHSELTADSGPAGDSGESDAQPTETPATDGPPAEAALPHTVFLHLGACYYYTESKCLMASANPVVRTLPTIPLGYGSRTWDFGWLMPRTDGRVLRWLCDPYELEFARSESRHALRWFVDTV